MKRFLLSATAAAVAIIAMGAFASLSLAAPGSRASIRAAGTKESITVSEDPAEFYGPVSCVVKRTVNKRFPGGRDAEKCTAVSGVLTNMVAGKGQKVFNGINGADEPFSVSAWQSDFDGKVTSEYEYSVAKSLKTFKIVAIYAAPEA